MNGTPISVRGASKNAERTFPPPYIRPTATMLLNIQSGREYPPPKNPPDKFSGAGMEIQSSNNHHTLSATEFRNVFFI